MPSLMERLSKFKVIPVITINNAEVASPLAKVLIENDLPCAEVTLRTPAALDSIKAMRQDYPDLLIAAGTCLSVEQVKDAISAGADFVVSPGLNPKVVNYCLDNDIFIIPGINNPSQVEQAMDLGLSVLKFFPAEPSGGIGMLKSLSAVYPVQFMPTGGINKGNLFKYLELSSVFSCGGSYMVPEDLIDKKEWEKLALMIEICCK